MEQKDHELSLLFKNPRNVTIKSQVSDASKGDVCREWCEIHKKPFSPKNENLIKEKSSPGKKGDNKPESGECKCDAECQDAVRKKKLLFRKRLKAEYTSRTICLCNIPQNVKKETVRRMCMRYGVVEAVTIKPAPVFDPCLPRTFNGYVRFSDHDDAQRALTLNGRLCKSNHLRALMASDVNKKNTGCTIFVGNIPYGAQEKDVWEIFEHTGTVVSVFLKRDEDDGTCIGYGYVTFRNPASAELVIVRQKPILFGQTLNVLRSNAKEIKEIKKNIESCKDKEKRLRQDLEESDESIEYYSYSRKKKSFYRRRRRKNKRKKLLKRKKRLMKRYTILPPLD